MLVFIVLLKISIGCFGFWSCWINEVFNWGFGVLIFSIGVMVIVGFGFFL